MSNRSSDSTSPSKRWMAEPQVPSWIRKRLSSSKGTGPTSTLNTGPHPEARAPVFSTFASSVRMVGSESSPRNTNSTRSAVRPIAATRNAGRRSQRECCTQCRQERGGGHDHRRGPECRDQCHDHRTAESGADQVGEVEAPDVLATAAQQRRHDDTDGDEGGEQRETDDAQRARSSGSMPSSRSPTGRSCRSASRRRPRSRPRHSLHRPAMPNAAPSRCRAALIRFDRTTAVAPLPSPRRARPMTR